jgi:hypothetical protein
MMHAILKDVGDINIIDASGGEPIRGLALLPESRAVNNTAAGTRTKIDRARIEPDLIAS